MESPKLSILIVEDEALLMKALHEKLVREGFHVINAYNGEEGLAEAKSHHPDLIILDILMPKMDGIEMAKKLRQDAWGKNAKIIVLTNYPEDGKKAVLHELGISDYLIKSNLRLEEILEIIKKKLNA